MNKEKTHKPKSGFKDMPKQHICKNPSHNPPSMMVIPAGKIYTHVCPGCGYKVEVTGSQISF